MKQILTLKSALVALCVLCVGVANAQDQTNHPKAFGIIGAATATNWYKDYVGTRLSVLSPSYVAGDKEYTTTNDGSGGTSEWGGYATTPIIDVPIVIPLPDSLAGAAFPAGSMTGKIALIYRGGGIEFVCKARRSQDAGAIACIIVNNIPGNPVGMGSGSTCSAVGLTIPIFMISQAEGDAIDHAYHNHDTAHITITPWGQGLAKDLGFVPRGVSEFHNYAIPYNQFTAGSQLAYKAVDGAFVANYGTTDATNVKLKTTVSFAPNETSPGVISNTEVDLASFPAADSIWAMYNDLYDYSGITGKGRVDIKYDLSSDLVEDYAGDNTTSTSFYTTDSLFSKGRYDFTNNEPIAGTFRAPTTGDLFMWGPTYYVAKGNGSRFDKVQWRMASNTDTAGIISSITQTTVFVFKWVDGDATNIPGNTIDSFIENGELQLLGAGIKSYGDPGDTSGGTFTVQIQDSLGNQANVMMADNSWYYIAPVLQNGWFLGCDGINNMYPRIFGKFLTNSLEYGSALWGGGRADGATPMVGAFTTALPPCPFGGSYDVDSVLFNGQALLTPAVPFTSSTHMQNVGVGTTPTKAFAQFDVYPNPTTDVLNVAIGLDNTVKNLNYTIINTQGQVILQEARKNVQNDKFTYSTSKLAAGTYYISVSTSEGKQMFKKFTVIR